MTKNTGKKVGRPKKFTSPEHLWQTFLDYVKEVKTHPKLVEDYVGKDANRVMRQKELPLTLSGFDIYCFNKGIIAATSDYFANKDEMYTEFSSICARIRTAIREDQISGGMVGIYNPSITARLNGLAEKTESRVDANVTNVGDMIKEFMK